VHIRRHEISSVTSGTRKLIDYSQRSLRLSERYSYFYSLGEISLGN
jgi:hypothetical protein